MIKFGKYAKLPGQQITDILEAQRRCDQLYRDKRQEDIRADKRERKEVNLLDKKWDVSVEFVRQRCPMEQCGSYDLELDRIGGAWVCVECGAVADERYYGDQGTSVLHRPRVSSPYNFMYHFNEVWAAYKGRGPLVHKDDFAVIKQYIETTYVVAFTANGFVPYNELRHSETTHLVTLMDPLRMQRVHYQQVCKLLGLGPLAERWVQIKRRICGAAWQVPYPSADEENAIIASFARFCGAFNALFYTSGKKRTAKDNMMGRTPGSMSRHNLPHYSWIIQNICFCLDRTMKERYMLDTFFPLQKTHNVKKKLSLLWVLVCRHLEWEVSLLY